MRADYCVVRLRERAGVELNSSIAVLARAGDKARRAHGYVQFVRSQTGQRHREARWTEIRQAAPMWAFGHATLSWSLKKSRLLVRPSDYAKFVRMR